MEDQLPNYTDSGTIKRKVTEWIERMRHDWKADDVLYLCMATSDAVVAKFDCCRPPVVFKELIFAPRYPTRTSPEFSKACSVKRVSYLG